MDPPPTSHDRTQQQTLDDPHVDKLDSIDLRAPPPQDPTVEPQAQSRDQTTKSVRWNKELTNEIAPNAILHADRPVHSPPETSSTSKVSIEKVKGMLGRWGKKAKEAAKKTEDYAGNVVQHFKTGPSVADTAMGRIAHSTRVLAEGGYEKIFKSTFQTLPEERLQKSFACYLSTSGGPVLGILYISTSKLAFCSDNPLSYQVGDKTEWSFYKVLIPLHQLRKVNPKTSDTNRSEKYIQVVSIDNHEFWFMGFMNYDSAVKNLLEASVANV